MKVLHLSTYDDSGGAARGAYWLHTALAEEGVESRMLVARKSGNDDTVFGPVEGPALLATKVRGRLDNLPLAFYEVDNFTMFSPAWVPTQVHRAVNRINPDIVHLHWICNGFMSPRDIAGIGLPIVWTMRDMWAFTGGCHYAKECDNYIRECGSCPHLNSGKENDLSRRVWRNKKQAWERKEFYPVAISQWLANCAQKSSLFGQYQTCTVPNALDETTFHPVDKLKARRALGLPEKGRIILFGSINATTYPRKGFDHVSTAVRIMVEQGWSEESAAANPHGNATSDLRPLR
jgi:hypothetical protein